MDASYLRVFTSLSHLDIPLTRTNVASFTSTLSHIPQLKALELGGDYGPGSRHLLSDEDWSGVLRAIASGLGQLEHLSITSRKPLEKAVLKESLPRLKLLSSLAMDSQCCDDVSDVEWWGWLKALARKEQKLEYLDVYGPHLPEAEVRRLLTKSKVLTDFFSNRREFDCNHSIVFQLERLRLSTRHFLHAIG